MCRVRILLVLLLLAVVHLLTGAGYGRQEHGTHRRVRGHCETNGAGAIGAHAHGVRLHRARCCRGGRGGLAVGLVLVAHFAAVIHSVHRGVLQFLRRSVGHRKAILGLIVDEVHESVALGAVVRLNS